jgi:hypothetical protein
MTRSLDVVFHLECSALRHPFLRTKRHPRSQLTSLPVSTSTAGHPRALTARPTRPSRSSQHSVSPPPQTCRRNSGSG